MLEASEGPTLSRVLIRCLECSQGQGFAIPWEANEEIQTDLVVTPTIVVEEVLDEPKEAKHFHISREAIALALRLSTSGIARDPELLFAGI
jgi:hypothetical protein